MVIRHDLMIGSLYLDYIAFNPDADGIEISDSVVPELVLSAFYDTLKRMKISYKKNSQVRRN